MQEKKVVSKKKTSNEKKDVPTSTGFLWSVAEGFLREFFSQAEKKIQQGAEEFFFFVKKKLVSFVLIFVGSGLFLAGVALALEKALAYWGFSGWGLILTGLACFFLAFFVNSAKR